MQIDHMLAERLCSECAQAAGRLDVSQPTGNVSSSERALIEHCNKVRKILQNACDTYRQAYDEEVRKSAQEMVDKQIAIVRRKIDLNFQRLIPEAIIPKYAHEGDAGMDVFAPFDTELRYGFPTVIKTGLIAEIPDGYELQVRPRSGLACKGVTVWNAPGTIDSKYRGEIGIILMFMNYVEEKQLDEKGVPYSMTVCPDRSYTIKAGDKIAQLVLAPVTQATLWEKENIDTNTDRGTGGFGSTGR